MTKNPIFGNVIGQPITINKIFEITFSFDATLLSNRKIIIWIWMKNCCLIFQKMFLTITFGLIFWKIRVVFCFSWIFIRIFQYIFLQIFQNIFLQTFQNILWWFILQIIISLLFKSSNVRLPIVVDTLFLTTKFWGFFWPPKYPTFFSVSLQDFCSFSVVLID